MKKEIVGSTKKSSGNCSFFYAKKDIFVITNQEKLGRKTSEKDSKIDLILIFHQCNALVEFFQIFITVKRTTSKNLAFAFFSAHNMR